MTNVNVDALPAVLNQIVEVLQAMQKHMELTVVRTSLLEDRVQTLEGAARILAAADVGTVDQAIRDLLAAGWTFGGRVRYVRLERHNVSVVVPLDPTAGDFAELLAHARRVAEQ